MQASNVEADVVACCSLINALERGGQWQLAEKLFLQMCTVQVGGGGGGLCVWKGCIGKSAARQVGWAGGEAAMQRGLPGCKL